MYWNYSFVSLIDVAKNKSIICNSEKIIQRNVMFSSKKDKEFCELIWIQWKKRSVNEVKSMPEFEIVLEVH